MTRQDKEMCIFSTGRLPTCENEGTTVAHLGGNLIRGIYKPCHVCDDCYEYWRDGGLNPEYRLFTPEEVSVMLSGAAAEVIVHGHPIRDAKQRYEDAVKAKRNEQ